VHEAFVRWELATGVVGLPAPVFAAPSTGAVALGMLADVAEKGWTISRPGIHRGFCCAPLGRPGLQPAWWRALPLLLLRHGAHNVPAAVALRKRNCDQAPPDPPASHFSWLWVSAFLANKQAPELAPVALAGSLESGPAECRFSPPSQLESRPPFWRLAPSWPICSAPRPIFLKKPLAGRCHSLRKYPTAQSPAQRRRGGPARLCVVLGSLYLLGPASLAANSATRQLEGCRNGPVSGLSSCRRWLRE